MAELVPSLHAEFPGAAAVSVIADVTSAWDGLGYIHDLPLHPDAQIREQISTNPLREGFARGHITRTIIGSPDATHRVYVVSGRHGTDLNDQELLLGSTARKIATDNPDVQVCLILLGPDITPEPEDRDEREQFHFDEPAERLNEGVQGEADAPMTLAQAIEANNNALQEIIAVDVQRFIDEDGGQSVRGIFISASAEAGLAGVIQGVSAAHGQVPAPRVALVVPNTMLHEGRPLEEDYARAASNLAMRGLRVYLAIARHDRIFPFQQSVSLAHRLGRFAITRFSVDRRHNLPLRMGAHQMAGMHALADLGRITRHLGLSYNRPRLNREEQFRRLTIRLRGQAQPQA